MAGFQVTLRGRIWVTAEDALKAAVLDENEDASVRTNAYAALIEVATNRWDSDFNVGKKTLRDVDWEWVSKLP